MEDGATFPIQLIVTQDMLEYDEECEALEAETYEKTCTTNMDSTFSIMFEHASSSLKSVILNFNFEQNSGYAEWKCETWKP